MRYEISGSTRSMPSMSSCGNIRPASTTRICLSHSNAHMLMPTSPRPPSGRYRSRNAVTADAAVRLPVAALHNGALVADLERDFDRVKQYLDKLLAPPPPPEPVPAPRQEAEQLRLL